MRVRSGVVEGERLERGLFRLRHHVEGSYKTERHPKSLSVGDTGVRLDAVGIYRHRAHEAGVSGLIDDAHATAAELADESRTGRVGYRGTGSSEGASISPPSECNLLR